MNNLLINKLFIIIELNFCVMNTLGNFFFLSSLHNFLRILFNVDAPNQHNFPEKLRISRQFQYREGGY